MRYGTTDQEKKEKAIEKRKELFSIAQLLRMEREDDLNKAKNQEEALEILKRPLNYYLKKYYGLEGKELCSFKSWQVKGRRVKKGEKGFAFFTNPIMKKEKKDENKKDGEISIKNKKEFYGICYLFHLEQTEETKQTLTTKGE